MTDIRQRWLAPRWLFTIATVLGLIAAIEHYVEMQHATDPLGWGHALGWRLPFWYLWALFAPLVAAGARRVSLTRQAWVGRGLVLLGFGVALSLAHAALELTAQRAVAPQFFDGGLWSAYLGSAGSWLPTNLLAFGALVGVTYASDFQDRYREQQLAASRLSAQLAQAELHALRMQLNPHFLFNAMNSVAMLVRHGEQTEAVRTIAALSDLLRLLLDEQRPDELPLRDEVAFVRRYLEIERVRFPDRLDVEVTVDEAVLDAQVPTLILQPLVENAIRHGIARRSTAGRVAIAARRVGDGVELEVRDDGPGLAGQPRDPGLGVGLRNTEARLRQLYGDGQSFALRDASAGGAVATIRLPYHTRPREAVA